MELSQAHGEVLKGFQGEFGKKAMNLLTGLGDFYQAEDLIPIGSVQVSGVSYKTGGDGLISVLEGFVADGLKVSVPTYLNPAGMDRLKWKQMGVRSDFAEKQNRIIELYKALGIQDICSCTPYNIIQPPGVGEHVAWAESSAVSYCNSVLGARTNREGSLSALASAVIGLTPKYGLHLDENRAPTHRVVIDTDLEDGDIPLMGKQVGKLVASGIPFFTGLEKAGVRDLKALGAAMAATGSVALYHVKGVTPEAGKYDGASLPEIVVGASELKEWRDGESEALVPGAELVVFGCPHCDMTELMEIAGYLSGGRVADGKRLWVFAPRAVLEDPLAQPALSSIADAGGEVYADTCCVVAPLEDLGLSGIVTDSGKASVYLKNFCKTAPGLMSKRKCIEFALK